VTERLDAVIAHLADSGAFVPPGRVRLDGNGDSPELSRALIDLIIDGKKRAGTALLWSFEHEGEPLPRVGDIDIVLDHTGAPVLVTRQVRVEVRPFAEVDAACAAIEGEGDGSHASWRMVHDECFRCECARAGRIADAAMPVVCNVFEVIATVPPFGPDRARATARGS